MGAVGDRQALLDEAAASEGTAWFDWWRSELTRQRRPAAGGWPGTLSEARTRIVRRIEKQFGPTFRATAAELELAARSLYLAAKRTWDERCDVDADPFDAP